MLYLVHLYQFSDTNYFVWGASSTTSSSAMTERLHNASDIIYNVKSAFSKGVGHFERKFQAEGGVAHNHCWCQKTTVITLSCGVTISAVLCLVLSHKAHM